MDFILWSVAMGKLCFGWVSKINIVVDIKNIINDMKITNLHDPYNVTQNQAYSDDLEWNTSTSINLKKGL